MKTRFFTTTALALFALLMLCGSTSAKGKEFRHASSLENAMDPEMKIEDWMVNDFVWNRSAGFSLTEESEETLEIESWMTNNYFWKRFETAEDAKLTLEPWMYNKPSWIPVTTVSETEAEEGLKLQAWMTDNNNWR